MHERSGSRLPDLDYRSLRIAQLESIKRGIKNIPGGKYENLLIYLKERSGIEIDAAELDRRMRTFFEDMITRVTKSPEEYDQDITLDGKALMDFLSGKPAAPETAAPPSPEEENPQP